MKNNSGYVYAGKHKLHYICNGNGSRLVLAFHGYGSDASIFDFLADECATVISIDLPYHGESSCEEAIQLTKEDLEKMVTDLMMVNKVQKVSLAGYSMGGRIVLSLVEQMPAHIENVVLLAPDGMSPNYFYLFLTCTRVGKFLFRDFMKRAAWYIRMMERLKKIGWVSKTRYKFALQYIDTPASRDFLEKVWYTTCKLVPRVPVLRKNIDKFHIPIHIIVGKYDTVIPVTQAKQFVRKIRNVHLHVLPRGHSFITDSESQQLVAACMFNQSNR